MKRWVYMAIDGRLGVRCPECGCGVRWSVGGNSKGYARCGNHVESTRAFYIEDLKAGKVKFCSWTGEVLRLDDGEVYIMYEIDDTKVT